jgi:hypothetical protein
MLPTTPNTARLLMDVVTGKFAAHLLHHPAIEILVEAHWFVGEHCSTT